MYPIPPNETLVETKTCRHCQASFPITDKDLEFYEKVSPVFAGKKYSIPTPTLCPDCRQQRRLSFRNERKLYKRKCDATGRDIISYISPDKPTKVYHQDFWWSDWWDAIECGRDFDFSRPFFDQLQELLQNVPQMWLLVANSENSPYVNYSANVKNCHLIFASSQNEDALYCRWVMHDKNIVDCNNCSHCENGYELIDCVNTNASTYCIGCVDCYACFGSYDLAGCQHCIGCSLLRNKSYCIDNIQYTKEEYMEKKKSIEINEKLLNFTFEKWIHRHNYELRSENVTGEYIIDSKNIFLGFEVERSEDCRRVTNTLDLKDTMDIDFQAFDCARCYESIGFENANNLLFSYGFLKGHSSLYNLLVCIDSNYLFWCIGLRNKQYCILNKQYTKEQYEILVPKIIEHMIKTEEWGEFFPSSLSLFGYNETVAQEYFPLSKADALNKWFAWSDYEAPFPKVEKIIPASKLPDDISKIPDDILNWAIECEVTKKPFRIIKQELEFYRKHNLPIPKRHPDQRHLDRMALRNPRKLFERKCDKCGKDMITTYAPCEVKPSLEAPLGCTPDRPEIVYCEECYNKEIL